MNPSLRDDYPDDRSLYSSASLLIGVKDRFLCRVTLSERLPLPDVELVTLNEVIFS